jgi:VanZ like family
VAAIIKDPITMKPVALMASPVQRIRKIHIALAVLSLIALLVGTQISGEFRDAIESQLFPRAFPFSAFAHFGLFALASWALHTKPLQVRARHVWLAALAVALVTEGLQHFAVGRHPRLRDVGIDMSGAAMGLLLSLLLNK